jgi:hypothetical protein
MTSPLTGQRRTTPSRDLVRQIVELASLAPSVHNTQPWSWHRERGRVQLYADRSRQLSVEDPTGRNLTISCGAALHHFRIAAGALGWQVSVDVLPEAGDSALLAEVLLQPSVRPASGDADLEALRNRCTDRRRFTSWPVPEERLESLAAVARRCGAPAVPVVDVTARFRLELAVNRALTLRQTDPAAALEQQEWIDRGSRDGVPLEVVPADPASQSRRSRFGAGLLEDARPDVESTDGVIVLGGATDDVAGWLATGEALSALWLEATRGNLSVVPLSQAIEVDETRRVVRETVLRGTMAPHLLLRIGWQAIGRSQLPRTPRRPVAELLSG